MKLYLAGPMTGYEDFNYPAFAKERERLRGAGYEVVCPAEENPKQEGTWDECLDKNLQLLVQCDGIALLGAWALSRGAQLELEVMLSSGGVAAAVDTWLKIAEWTPRQMQLEAERRVRGEG